VEPEPEPGQKKKKKKEESVISSKTIGDIARKDLRLPTKRLGSGYIVILESSTAPEAAQERLEVLKVKYGLSIKAEVGSKGVGSTGKIKTVPVQTDLERYAEMADEQKYEF
jgi:phage host-nuclease inhibitor protein Gam